MNESKCDSGLFYSFEPEGCVDKALTRSALTHNANDAFCPGEGNRSTLCGVPAQDGGVLGCGANEACMCGVRSGAAVSLNVSGNPVCVRAEPSCHEAGTLGLATLEGTCVEGAASASELELRFAGEGACPGYSIDDFRHDAGTPRCGVPESLGGTSCGENQACLCGLREGATGSLNVSNYSCIQPDPLNCKADGGVGLREVDGGCLTGVSSIESLVVRLPGDGLCPGFNIDAYLSDSGTVTADGGVP